MRGERAGRRRVDKDACLPACLPTFVVVVVMALVVG